MTEDGMAVWHHQLDEHESEQAQRVGDGQGSLACCSPGGRRELDTTERLKNNTKTCSSRFPGPQSASLHRELLPGVSKVSSCSSLGFSLPRGTQRIALLSFSRWQTPFTADKHKAI